MKTLSLVVCGILCTGTVYGGSMFAASIVLASGGGSNPIPISSILSHPPWSYSIAAGSNGGGIISFINDYNCQWSCNVVNVYIGVPVSLTAPGEVIKGFSTIQNPRPPFNQVAQTTVIGTSSNGMQVRPFYNLYVGTYFAQFLDVYAAPSSPTSGGVGIGFQLVYIGPGQEFSLDLNNAFQNDVNKYGEITAGANFNGVGGFSPYGGVGVVSFQTPESPVALEAVAMAGVGLLALAIRRGRFKKVVGSLI